VKLQKTLIHLIFWPIALVSLFMNIWLFSSFFSNWVYRVFGGIIGGAIDLFKLYSLYNFDHQYRLYKNQWGTVRKEDKAKKKEALRESGKVVYSFPVRSLLHYLFFLVVSAGASLLFGLIDIDRSIQKQSMSASGASRVSIERDIEILKSDIEDLLDFSRYDKMSDRIVADTNRFLLSSGLLRIEEEKDERRKKAKALSEELAVKEKELAGVIENSRSTFEAFKYLARLIPSVDEKGAKMYFLFLIIVAIERLTEEGRAAMAMLITGREVEQKKRGRTSKNKTTKGPVTGGEVYKRK